MKRLLPCGALWLALAGAASAASSSCVNSGTVTFPPQIDAAAFVNNGVLSITGLATINEADHTANGVWGYYTGNTNPPIVFPDSLSISNLEWMVLHPNSP